MKSLLLVLSLLVLPICAHAREMGNEGANGGDEIALEFRLAFSSAVNRTKTDLPTLYTQIIDAKLESILADTEILVVDTSLIAMRDGIFQDSIALNSTSPRQIVVNRRRWKEIEKNEIREALALHEVASLAGLESTGKYPMSGNFLTLFSLDVDPQYDFTPACGKFESMAYQRTLWQLGAGEVSRLEVDRAAVALQEQLKACGVLPKKQFCDVVLPKLQFIALATAAEFKEGRESEFAVEVSAGELKRKTKYCNNASIVW